MGLLISLLVHLIRTNKKKNYLKCWCAIQTTILSELSKLAALSTFPPRPVQVSEDVRHKAGTVCQSFAFGVSTLVLDGNTFSLRPLCEHSITEANI